jgi:hypothetical protein
MGSPNRSSSMITTPTASPHTPIVEDIATVNQPLLTAATRLLAFATLLTLASHACQSWACHPALTLLVCNYSVR